MKSPFTGKEMILQKEIRTLTFRKEKFDVNYHFFLCEDSKEQFTNADLDEINLTQLYNQFRVAHNLPFPDEIIAIREKYGLSASKMSEVLGFGVNTYRNYEAGEVPNESNARLIHVAKDPVKFLELVEISGVYSENELNKIRKHIEKIIEAENAFQYKHHLIDYLLGSRNPDIYSGFKTPNLKKFTEMVVYFTKELQPWKTKLNKLLFYADFLHFKKTCFSISGVRYRAIDMGPVPNNFQSIFEYISNNEDVIINHIEFQDGNIGEQFILNPKRKFEADVLTGDEYNTVKEVAKKFQKTSTNNMILISHKEKAWKENFESGRQLIKYDYSFDLTGL